ncbi:MAG: SPOR domain-containing protein [Candidatus Krumholzibacteriia bacterium]
MLAAGWYVLGRNPGLADRLRPTDGGRTEPSGLGETVADAPPPAAPTETGGAGAATVTPITEVDRQPVTPMPRHWLHVASFRDPGRAERFGDQLAKAGVEVEVRPVTLDGGQVWQRVLVGLYPTWTPRTPPRAISRTPAPDHPSTGQGVASVAAPPVVAQLVEQLVVGGAENLALRIAGARAAAGGPSLLYTLKSGGPLEAQVPPTVPLRRLAIERASVRRPPAFLTSINAGRRRLRRQLADDRVAAR